MNFAAKTPGEMEKVASAVVTAPPAKPRVPAPAPILIMEVQSRLSDVLFVSLPVIRTAIAIVWG